MKSLIIVAKRKHNTHKIVIRVRTMERHKKIQSIGLLGYSFYREP